MKQALTRPFSCKGPSPPETGGRDGAKRGKKKKAQHEHWHNPEQITNASLLFLILHHLPLLPPLYQFLWYFLYFLLFLSLSHFPPFMQVSESKGSRERVPVLGLRGEVRGNREAIRTFKVGQIDPSFFSLCLSGVRRSYIHGFRQSAETTRFRLHPLHLTLARSFSRAISTGAGCSTRAVAC